MTISDTPSPALKTSTTNKTLPHPLNAWYVAAWDHEVTKTSLLARKVANRPMAVYRTDEGRPVALADACWHRLAPLSMGRRVGSDEVQCPYHGLKFNSAGRCTYMPAQETINPSAMVPSFPAVERYRYIWVWPGDPTMADPDAIPDMSQITDPEWTGDGEVLHIKGNYQLVLDNLMDLTHEEFVHTDSIGQEGISHAGFDVIHDERSVTLSRWMLGIDPPPFLLKNLRDKFPGFEGKVDRWQIIHFYAPSTICIDVGVAKAGTGAPEGDRSQGMNNYVMNTISPETDKSCHYYWAHMRNYRLESQLITTQSRQAIARVFKQDEVIINAQQEAIDANPDYEFYSLNIDAGGMWVRRLIERMIEAEKSLHGLSDAGF